MKALGLVVSDKKFFENCILKTYFLTLWPTYATNCNGLNNIDRGPPRDHSCEVWSKSSKWFQRRCCLKKLLTHGRTDGRTDDGRRTLVHHKSSPWALCAQVSYKYLTILSSSMCWLWQKQFYVITQAKQKQAKHFSLQDGMKKEFNKSLPYPNTRLHEIYTVISQSLQYNLTLEV